MNQDYNAALNIQLNLLHHIATNEWLFQNQKEVEEEERTEMSNAEKEFITQHRMECWM